jgi:subtilisin family serine protease
MSLIRNWVKGRRSTSSMAAIAALIRYSGQYRMLPGHLLTPSQEFAATGRTVDSYVVPNALTLSVSPFVASDDVLAPEDMTDYNGHGTAVASVAGGITQGVASGANLVIVKFRNAATQSKVGKLQLRGVTAAALRDAWDHSINDIIDRRNGGDTGKFVINMSYGTLRSSQN